VEEGKVNVRYDNGCYCCSNEPRPSNIEDVIEHISIQINKEHIEEIRKFWENN
jgi:hypothetical protein